jgi:uncharacterized protein (TIGR03435 family)
MADYELVLAKGGTKLKEGDVAEPMTGADGKPLPGGFLRMTGTGRIDAQAFTTEGLAHFLMQPMVGLGRRVVDKTGLTAKYNFKLNWTPDPGLGGTMMGGGAPPPPPPGGDTGPSIFTALEEQLGLKLQPSTGMFDVMVVEHVERPSEN